MISNFCLKFKHDHVLTILSLVLVWLNYTATVISKGNQVEAAVVMNKKCINKERRALLDIKALLQDPYEYHWLSTWGIDDCCEWMGVSCNNQTGHVTELDLAGHSLEGEISTSLLNLTCLTILDLSFNDFNGTIPMFIGSLTELRYLDLAYNSFDGTIPISIGSLNKLMFLDLSYNYFNGTIPMSIGSLTELRYLYLSSNVRLGYEDPSEGGNLTKLHHLYVENLDWLSNLSHLELLQMEGVSLANANHWLNIVTSLQNLTYLSLEGCNLSKVMHPYSSSSVDSSSSSSSIRDQHLGDNNLNSSFSHWLFASTGNRLQYFNLSGNMLEVIDLSSCKLGPRFPTWIHTLKNLTSLDIASNGISDSIPREFWDMWPSQLRYLNLSSNNISGKVPDLSSNFYSHAVIDLSSNNFYGPIPNVSSSLASLNLSTNKFFGGISFLCHQLSDRIFKYLDLSHNLLTGQIPDCLWHFQDLEVLNLGDNKFSGRLPASVEYLISLEVLYLYNNNFSGELPLSLRNCTMLSFLDLGANMFSGNVPVWIGENLSRLYALSLSSNNFFGAIPIQLCQLVELQILDLSMNNLNGTIPSCINNLTAMVQEGSFTIQNVHLFETYGSFGGDSETTNGYYADQAIIQWQGNKREFSRNLGLLKSIDLSSNNLRGKIPNELTDLHGLLSLNLSKNALVGEIPQKIGQMRELLVLDVSRNNISGGLPSNMSQMTLLDYLDVSYNSLSGRIPSSTQLQSLESSRYTGNEALCGPPLTKHCPGDKELQVKPPIGESRGDGEDRDELERWFYIGGTTGFAIGLWMVCSALLVNRRGRHTFFHFMGSLENWVYVKVMVFIAKFQRAAHT